MNFLFGLIPAVSILILLLWLRVRGVIKTDTMLISIFTVGFITAVLAAQTYGPRNELSKTALPTTPERVKVETGENFVDPVDRRRMFEEQLNK